MELSVFNEHFDLLAIIDDFISLIWTERQYSFGDFELFLPTSQDIVAILSDCRYLKKSDSDTIMMIDTILMESDVENGKKITISGKSLESILNRRIIWLQQKYEDEYLDQMLSRIVYNNVTNPNNIYRKIPELVLQNDIVIDRTNLAIDTDLTDRSFTGDNLYNIFENACKNYNLGFNASLVKKENSKLFLPFYDFSDDWILSNSISVKTYDGRRYLQITPASTGTRIINRYPIRINGRVGITFAKTILNNVIEEGYMFYSYYVYPISSEHPAHIVDSDSANNKLSTFTQNVTSIWSEEISLDEKKSLLLDAGYTFSVVENLVEMLISGEDITLSIFTGEQLRELGIDYYHEIIDGGTRTFVGPKRAENVWYLSYPNVGSRVITEDGQQESDAYIYVLISKEGNYNGSSYSQNSNAPKLDMFYTLSSMGFNPINNNGYSSNLDKSYPDVFIKFSFTQGSFKPNICFSSEYDNLISSNYLSSDSEFKTIALIGGENKGDVRTYVELEQQGCAESEYFGLKRRELFVDARDLQSTDDEGNDISEEKYRKSLITRGKNKLNEAVNIIAVEGEAESTQVYRIGRDFKMGDIVTVKDDFGHYLFARVSETVESYDENGYSLYPTFETV